jgi:hypothetical protein
MTVIERELLAIAIFESSVRSGNKSAWNSIASDRDWCSMPKEIRDEWRNLAVDVYAEGGTYGKFDGRIKPK